MLYKAKLLSKLSTMIDILSFKDSVLGAVTQFSQKTSDDIKVLKLFRPNADVGVRNQLVDLNSFKR